MDLQPQGYDKVVRLVQKGATIPNPLTVDIGEEVDVDRISSDGVTIYPGCRIYGADTVISAGVTLGAEAPVTIDGCRLGPSVELKGGYVRKSVLLEGAVMGSGAQLREACLIEEGAGGAHCVGLKQTILFPFVTLGSHVNFCDCLMAGGASRADHSEVGSSYVHFNYTPDGDKATASLFGDVPRGVMLDQPPIFLGGQGGAIGPVRVGYGTVVAAGSVLRHDVLEDGKLVVADQPAGFVRDHRPFAYRNLGRVLRNNIVFLANLAALEEWYRKVRQPLFGRQELGALVYVGALEVIALAKEERTGRLVAMAEKVDGEEPAAREFRERAAKACAVFGTIPQVEGEAEFLSALSSASTGPSADYIEAIQGLEPEVSGLGTAWLQRIVDELCSQVDALLPSLELFRDRR